MNEEIKAIPLTYLKERGISLEKGDMVTLPVSGGTVTINFLYKDDIMPSWYLTSFAERKNTGVQPCPDDVVVEISYQDLDKGEGLAGHDGLAGHYAWARGYGQGNIIKWKPCFDTLYQEYLESLESNPESIKEETDTINQDNAENASEIGTGTPTDIIKGADTVLTINKEKEHNIYTEDMFKKASFLRKVCYSGMKW